MKKIISLILALILLFSFSACRENAINDDQSQTTKALKSARTLEELESAIKEDLGKRIEKLNKEVEDFLVEIDTYEKYSTNIDKVKAFYGNIITKTDILCVGVREYCVTYAELILKSDKSFDDKYDDFEELYDVVYDDAREEVYDEIYDHIFDELYDALYDDIMDEAYDNLPYEKWSDIKSAEYDLWSDSKSEVYDIWSDCGSDIYDFWSDMRSEMYQKDTERAEKKLEKYKKDLEELYANLIEDADSNKEQSVNKEKLENTNDETDWEEFLLNYETWVDDYIAIVKKYKDNPTDASILSDYTEMVAEIAEWAERADEIKLEIEDTSDALEYTKEVLRIAGKIAEATN